MDALVRGSLNRSRWAAAGAAVAITVGSGGLMSASAAIDSGSKPVFVSITPCRVMDTRPAPETVGPRSTPIGANEVHSITVVGNNGNCTDIPADAVGISMNIAAVFPTASSFLTVFPFGATLPVAANLNWVAGQAPISNAVNVKTSADGKVSFYNLAGTVHVTADINGYYVDHTHDDRYYTKTQLDAREWGSANIADGAVTSAKVLDDTEPGGGLAAVDLAPNSVGASEIATDAVNATEIADNSIDSGEVVDFGLSNQDVGVLFAQVNADGTIANHSGGVTGTRIGAGTYEVDFGRNISSCAFVITQGEAGIGGAGGAITGATDRAGNVNAVFATTRDATGTLADRAFHLVVVC